MTSNFNIYPLIILKSTLVTCLLLNWSVYCNQQNRSPVMRVLLCRNNAFDSTWYFTSSDPFRVQIVDTRSKKTMLNTNIESCLSITKKGSDFIINKKKYHHALCTIMPSENNTIVYNGLSYQGVISLQTNNNDTLCINHIALEDYVYSVLRSESWPGWCKEVNMAFAIACRTYALKRIMQARKKNALYDIKNSNIHQTYTGYHNTSVLAQAVFETQGLIITYRDKPIDAMFDSCCGGIIPADMQDVDFKQSPYLKRTQACNYCKSCSLYNWKLEMTQHEFEKILQDNAIPTVNMHDIVVSKKDKAGIVHELILKNRGKHRIISGKKLYSMSKLIKSYAFSIAKKSHTITFLGKGYGHHLGMCQWGAKTMTDLHYNYRSILQFYYPHTTLMKLSYSAQGKKGHARL